MAELIITPTLAKTVMNTVFPKKVITGITSNTSK